MAIDGPTAQELEREIAESAKDAAAAMGRTIAPFVGVKTAAETATRVLKAFAEMLAGYRENPIDHLRKTFETETDDLVVVRGIRFVSVCEHHLLPFTGVAAVGYIPNKKLVGLSKLARLVSAYARRLQLQERLTAQVAHTLQQALDCQAVGVVIRASHCCMQCRGVRQTDADAITSCFLGAFRSDPAARAEFLSLVLNER